MNKKLFYFVLILVLGVLAACGTSEKAGEEKVTGDATEEKKTLTMGTSADYAPFEYVDAAKGEEIIGYDIDLAKLIGEELGFEVEVVDMDFNSLIPALQSGKIDFIISGMSPNEERNKVVDFSMPYNETKQMIVTPADSDIKTLEDLKDKTVGVQTASIQEELAKTINETTSIKIESRNRITELIQEMKAGRFDAAVIEGIVADGVLAKNDDLTAFPAGIDAPDYKAVVVPEGSDMKAQVDEVLQKLKDNGKIAELEKKWLVEQ